jgi:mRNA interferase YafQ
MFELKRTGQFKKDVKLCNKRNYDLSKLLVALQTLENTGTLPPEYNTHKLKGKAKNEETWDGHIEPDWLILWQVKDSENILFDGVVVLVRTGTHSDLFG